MEFKIGQKVNVPLGVGVIKYYMGGSTVWVSFDENMAEIELDIKHLKPYKTAHEKLIDMGFTRFYELSNSINYSNGQNLISFDKGSNTVLFYNRFNMDCSVINMELSRILTQYLEEMEEK